MRIPIWISNRHIHLSEKDAITLFGNGYEFTKRKDLTQTWSYACEETLTIEWMTGKIENIRVLMPFRRFTQVEILREDQEILGTNAPVRLSGDLKKSAPVKLIWPLWEKKLSQWMIIAQKHIHVTKADADDFKLKGGHIIKIKAKWTVFENVAVRVRDNYLLDFHIDKQEAREAWIKKGDRWEIIYPI